MRLDAQQIRDGAVFHGDICIVGGGPAGITLARELIAHSCSVVCIESGGLEPEDSAQSLNDGTFIGAPYAGLRQTRHRQAGGTAQTWNTPLYGEVGAKYVPLDPCDFQSRSGVAHSGWPFDHAYLESYYQRAQVVCGLGPFVYDGDRWRNQRNTFPLPDTRLRRAVYQFGAARAFTESHLQAILSSDNVQLLYHATACSLTMHSDRRSVLAVEAATLAGNRFQVRSHLFVLAAGAIENTRLLLVSREPGREAPGDEHDWLGRCFMEHPRDRAMLLFPRGPEIYAQAAFYDRHASEDGTVVGGRIAIDPRTIVDEQLPNASVTMFPLLRSRVPGAGMLERIVAQVKRHLGREPSRGYGWSQTSQPERAYRGFQLLLNTEQLPHRDNRVVLGRELDRLGVPKPEVHWQWRARDQFELQRLRVVVADALGAAGIGRIETDGNCMPDPNAHHHAGTTRMHEHSRHGVVDPDSRIHGNENLYVTGSSVFPTAGFANPTLTVVALALRLADHLKSRL